MTAQLALFACNYNAGRSQIANAFSCQLADPARTYRIAAGLDPSDRIQDEVVEILGALAGAGG